MKIIFLVPLLLPCFAFASGELDVSKTDIIPRVINFLIFISILFYIAKKYNLKSFFTDRQFKIADMLNKMELKLKESKKKKEAALRELEEAKIVADRMISDGEMQAKEIILKNNEKITSDIANLKGSFEDSKLLAIKNMKADVVREVFSNLDKDTQDYINGTDYANIILKKVSQ